MRTIWMIFFIIICTGITPALSVSADERPGTLYQWQDSDGVVHLSDRIESIPRKYRSKVKIVEPSVGAAEQLQSEESTQEAVPEDNAEDKEAAENAQKEAWQARMHSAKEQLSAAISRSQELDQQYSELQKQRNPLTFTYSAETQEQMARIEQEQRTTKKLIEDYQHQVDVVIPDEARKAGIPPGWLRE